MTLDDRDRRLVDALPASLHAANGVPAQRPPVGARDEAIRAIEDGTGGKVRVSPLGPEWSADLDVHVTEVDRDALRERGWIPLAPLLARIGSSGERWLVLEGGRALGGADLHAAPAPDPVDQVLARCRRRREVRLREILELRALQRAGATLPHTEVVAAAAAAEAALGGDELAAFRDATAPQLPPIALARAARLRSTASAVRRAVRPKVVVAFSGVDGSGKSTLTREVAGALEAAGVPASIVWSRPGMRLGPLDRVARVLRRASGGGDEPGVRAVAAGRTDVASRKGVVGAVWSVLVTVAFLVDVRRQHAAARGVVLYDRHLVDALVTLDFVYGGASLVVPRLLVRSLLPRARVAFYVEVPENVAVARKPGDTFGAHAVRTQLAAYATALASRDDVVRLDGTRPLGELVAEVLERIAG